MKSIKCRTVGDLKEVCFGGSILPDNDEVVYFVVTQPGQNTTIIRPLMLGEEYPKTYGHYHKNKTQEKYYIAYGEGLVLLQKERSPGVVEEVRVTPTKAGQVVTIPGEYAHCQINLRQSPLVTVDDADPHKETNNYESIKERGGFCYFFLSDGRGGWRSIPNSKYQVIPPLEVTHWNARFY